MRVKCFLIFLSFGLLFSCKKGTNRNTNALISESKVQYAKGFSIVKENGSTKLIIKKPFLNANTVSKYTIVKKSKSVKKQNTKSTIQVPLQKVIVTSTTHIPMVELLQEEKAIVGFPHAAYISSKKSRNLVTQGKIKEIGKEGSLNTEIVLDIEPELVVGYSVNNADRSLTTIEKSGIPVIYNGDWLEETPLGRAEWIKFFGVLFDKEKAADSIFKIIENNYLKAKAIAKNNSSQKTVLSGAVMSNDVWNLPAGESFVAQFLKDANLNYLWKDTKGKGSLSLSFESVYDKALNADIWISPGYFNSKEQMLNFNPLYENFKAFKNDLIFTPTTKKGDSGGVLYYELGLSRPDLVLKDIIKITQPKLLKDYTLTFFKKMK